MQPVLDSNALFHPQYIRAHILSKPKTQPTQSRAKMRRDLRYSKFAALFSRARIFWIMFCHVVKIGCIFLFCQRTTKRDILKKRSRLRSVAALHGRKAAPPKPVKNTHTTSPDKTFGKDKTFDLRPYQHLEIGLQAASAGDQVLSPSLALSPAPRTRCKTHWLC